jgi:hypothetical protein
MINSIPWIVGLSGLLGLLALIFRNKGIEQAEQLIQSQTKAEDAPLAAQQAADVAQVKVDDAGIQALKDEREKLRNEYLTDQQKADTWNQK